jgi:hypothetical protein
MRYIISLFLFFAAFTTLNCDNPFKEDKKKEEIRILLDEYLSETGRYIMFWDGKDKNGKFVSPGKYIYLLEWRGNQDQAFVNVETGGKLEENNEGHFQPGTWMYTELQAAYPDPFKVRAGTNIPFLLSGPVHVKITIFKD